MNRRYVTDNTWQVPVVNPVEVQVPYNVDAYGLIEKYGADTVRSVMNEFRKGGRKKMFSNVTERIKSDAQQAADRNTPLPLRGEEPLTPLGYDVASYAPVVGDAIQAGEAVDAAARGNYGEAALLGSLLFLPNALQKRISKLAKKSGKNLLKAPVETPAHNHTESITVGAIEPTAYEITNFPGYQLKSLMRGNPLEKQLSKQGTVSVNSIKAQAGKASKVDQAVIDKVLSDEAFAGKKAIDYNQFRKAVQDELITYDRMPDTRYNDYGMDRIGMGHDSNNPSSNGIWSHRLAQENLLRENPERTAGWNIEPDGYFSVSTPAGSGQSSFISPEEVNTIFPDWIEKYTPKQLATPETYTFSSPRIPRGSDKHYNPNTLGHSRTYTTSDEPNVLHVMESQSDWGQHELDKTIGEDQAREGYRYAKETVDETKKALDTGIDYHSGEQLSEEDIKYYKDELAKAESRLELWSNRLSKIGKKTAQEKYLHDNFTSRQIQENLRYAAEKGQTKMRYPTRETAAKIEGYPTREAYFNEKGEDVTTAADELFTFGDKLDARKAELTEKMKALKNESLQKYGIDFSGEWWVVPEEEQRQWNKNRDLYNKYTDEVLDIVQGKKGKAQLKPGITKKTVYEYEDILKKYSDFPKQYKKLFKNADVRTVTDSQGNTWYEVDVPKDYLQQEWQYEDGGLLLHDYKTGGKIHIAPSKKGTFTAAAKKHGKSVQAFASQVLAHKENYSPAMVKKANFARNAAKWHGDGGLIERYGADAVRKALEQKKKLG